MQALDRLEKIRVPFLTCGHHQPAQLELALVLRVTMCARWQIHHGILVEEPSRKQTKPCLFHRHHRPVLWPRDMCRSNGVPSHEVAIHDATILFGVSRQAMASTGHGSVFPSGIELPISVGRCPEIVLGKRCSLCNCGRIMRKQAWCSTLHDLVGNRLSQAIFLPAVSDLPNAVLFWSTYPFRLTLSLQQPTDSTEDI